MEDLAKYICSIPDYPKQGIIFRDITPLIESRTGFRESIEQLAAAVAVLGPIDKIVAPEARGFIFGAPLALKIGAGFVPLRKPGKLPRETLSISYSLEYGNDELHVHIDSIKKKDRVLFLDDLLGTGGTAEAGRKLVEKAGGSILGAAFVIELVDLKGRERLAGLPIFSLITFEGE